MRTTRLSRKMPTKGLGSKTVVVETGSGRDRREGYEKDHHNEFTGDDARASLVGAYRKRGGKKFGKKSY
jgi:hypothetical protein